MDFQRSNSQLPMSSGLTRYRSAPSSYFSSFLDAVDDAIRNDGRGGAGDDFNTFLDRFMPSNSIRTQGQGSSSNNCFSNTVSLQSQSQFVAPMKQEQDVLPPPPQQGNQSNYSPASPVMHRNQGQTQPQAQLSQRRSTNSVGSNRLAAPMKMVTGGENSNLIRYNSSPAGFFADINIENEYGAMRGMGNFGAGNNSANATSFHGPPVDFSSAQASHSGLMPPISETNPGDTSFGENQKIDSNYMSGFPVTSWDDSAIISDSFLKGLGDDDHDDNDNKPLLSNLGEMNNEGSKRPRTLLSHHLSLPKTSDELSSMETLMQDSVLCKLRAKRGCATHPRSIAERVRRTRISERMRKLQDLVPNMDKQTNTSDMLDLAVDYIKDLQKQLQTLSDNRAKCTCLN